jgi:signal transduction histidine kinase
MRLRKLDEFKADALLAAAFGVAGVLESIFVRSGGHSRPLTAAAAVALSFTLMWRRRSTTAAIVGFVAVIIVASKLNTFIFGAVTSPFIALLVVAYTVGRREPSRRMWVEVLLLAAALVIAGGIRRPTDVLWSVIFLGGPVLAGRALRSRSLLQREMAEKARRLEGEREMRAQRAVEDERARIAAELQAVVANGVSAMVVQAEAVPRLFSTGERAAARQALTVIEETGRDALAEMRRLLGVLRRDNEGAALAPQPSLARADALLARMEAQGLVASLNVEGKPVALAPGINLAAYRVLQEALASATEAHGVSRADVSIVYGEDNVSIKVRDDRQGSAGLAPEVLRALRERVSLYGGALRAGPSRGGPGLELEVRLPVGGPR